jgi:VCBS repeat-containing protein
VVNLIRSDLEFILDQIRIAEAHAAGTPLTEIRVDEQGRVTTDGSGTLAISHPLLPYGLRTVDGSYNNLNPGREQWGASDKPFISLLTPQHRDEQDGDTMPLGPFTTVTNTNYGVEGNVADADPRLISNLIVDQTVANPAAVAAGLAHAGLTGAALNSALQAVMAVGDLDARSALLTSQYGVEVDAGTRSITLPNVAPDEGLSAPFNGWFTLFGQFFDHGLDLVKKGGSGTVFIPLQQDDPLYVDGSHANFMAMTRIDQGAPNNVTTPFVDQNQTYTSHASHQVFLREYALVDGKPVATGHLLEGERGLATWGDVKQQAREMLGIELTDADVFAVPLLRTDPYGNFIPGPDGFPQVITDIGPDGIPNTADDVTVSGTPDAPVSTANAVRIANAFLDDIAHSAVPVLDGAGALQADDDDVAGNPIARDTMTGAALEYDNELLDAHYITGDGRGNENFGLSAVHHIFHSEHNHLVDQVKQVVLATGDLGFLNEWLRVDVPEIPQTQEAIDALQWDGTRLFAAARFTNEMEYQHLVFEEFARKVQPDVDAFVFNPSMDINPAIFAEFAHVVYRFGHSMLRETVDQINADGTTNHVDLFDAFLNPLGFGSDTVDHATAAGAIVRGMTAQVGNEIDEFVTHVLRNQLVGIPLDLAAINIARGRDAGIPSLNEARRQFKEVANGDTQLDPYTSWTDFALNLKTPASIVNFIAAYGTHDAITGATTVEAKRQAAMNLVFGGSDDPVYADRLDFLNARGAYAGGDLGGLEKVDLWVGGLAEKKMAFGGMLGSTFSFIFELQLENLQNGDRFYYLSRVQGLNLLNELENNSLAKMAMRNTDLGAQDYALPGDIFSTPDHVLYVDPAKQALFGTAEPQHEDPFLEALSPMVERDANYIRYNGLDHVVIGGTDEADRIISGGGDDAVWAFDGNDTIEAGYGVDKVHGGVGDDIITNNGTDIGEVDMLHGEEGNDVIHGGSGLALIFGNQGNDAIITGPDGKEAFGGTGDDFMLGGDGGDFLLGNEGDDWIEGANGFDVIAGDNSELFFNSPIIGHDVMFAGQNEQDFDAESGDDIMVQGESVIRNEGMFGYDWAIHKGVASGAYADLRTPIFTTDQQDILRNRFDQVEGLSGWNHDDRLFGDDRSNLNDPPATPGAGLNENRLVNNELTQAGVDRIAGLRELMGGMIAPAPTGPGVDLEAVVAFDSGNILLGGDGNDVIEGRGGDDRIDGDAWLNVRIRVDMPDAAPDFSIDSLVEIQTQLLTGAINPGQLSIVREILVADGTGDLDTAVFSGDLSDYTVTALDPTTVRVVDNRGIDSSAAGDVVSRVELFRFADGTRTFRELTNLAPEITTNGGLPLVLSLNENTAAGTMVVDAEATDPNALDTLTWSIASGNAQGLFAIDPATGLITLAASPDYEALAALNATSQVLTVAVSDGLATDTLQVTVNVANVNEAPVVGPTTLAASGEDMVRVITVAELLANASDQDAGTTLTVQGLSASSGQIIANPDGSWTFIPNENDDTSVTFTYTVSDGVLGTAATASLDLVGANDVNGTNAANNLSRFGNFNDQFHGFNGADTISANGGDDTLFGGVGGDSVHGGGGNDVFVATVTDGNDTYNGGAGIDTYDLSRIGVNVTVNLALSFSQSSQTGTDSLTSIENVIGGRGNNSITGSNVANLLDGGWGNDVLNGGGDSDTLIGGWGNDSLDGGSGADVLTGGAGADRYYYSGNTFGALPITTGNTAATRDRILDFQQGLDRIDLSAIDANRTGILDFANNAFVFGGEGPIANTSVAAQLRYRFEAIGGIDHTIVEGTVNATAGIDFQIELVGRIALTAADFVL